MNTFDVIVIGGGPGGYVAAIRAQQLGLKTALIEKQHLGGVCLNWGCIPTKALLRTSEIFSGLRHLGAFGIQVENPRFDLKKVVQRSRDVAAQLSKGIGHLLKKNKVTLFEGEGVLEPASATQQPVPSYSASSSSSQLSLPQKGHVIKICDASEKTQVITGKNIIIATGARPRVLPNLEPDGKLIWTSRDAMIPTQMPKKLLVVGSGAIGIEFASFYNAFGVEVIVVELQECILPVEDEEISRLAQKALEKQGIRFFLKTTVEALKKEKDTVHVTLKTPQGSEVIHVDRIISAVGIVGNTENLNLDKTQVKVEKNQIITDRFCATAEPGIYAIGDVTAGPWLAHKASHEGILCVEHIAGHSVSTSGLNRQNIPGCTYCMPQIASVGLTEKSAKAQGLSIKVGRFPFAGNGKAVALGESEGLVKTIFDAKTGELLGAHMIGAEVTELIHGFCIAKTLEATEEDLMHTIFPHPTLSEMMHESVLDAYGRAIHF